MRFSSIRLNAAQKAAIFLTAVCAGLVGFAIATRPANNGLGDLSAVGLLLSSSACAVAGTFDRRARPCAQTSA